MSIKFELCLPETVHVHVHWHDTHIDPAQLAAVTDRIKEITKTLQAAVKSVPPATSPT